MIWGRKAQADVLEIFGYILAIVIAIILMSTVVQVINSSQCQEQNEQI